MSINDLKQINFDKYPKSNNKLISWTKKDNVGICHLNENCSELVLKINDNSLCDTKIIFTKPLFDNLPKGKQSNYESFSLSNDILRNYNHVFSFFVIILIITIILRCRKN